MINYKYAKIKNDKIIFAKEPLKINQLKDIINPTEQDFLSLGYLKVIEEPKPQEKEGCYYIQKYVIKNNIPTKIWEEQEIINLEIG